MRASVTEDRPCEAAALPSADPGSDRPKRNLSRSLVPLATNPTGTATTSRNARPSAAFLAQLIAIAQGVPQTRLRGRAEIGDGVDVYGAAAEVRPKRPVFSRLA
jgi:hypothetical protein